MASDKLDPSFFTEEEFVGFLRGRPGLIERFNRDDLSALGEMFDVQPDED